MIDSRKALSMILKGMDLNLAVELLRQEGRPFVIEEVDGKSNLTTCDFNINRARLTIVNSKITKVTWV